MEPQNNFNDYLLHGGQPAPAQPAPTQPAPTQTAAAKPRWEWTPQRVQNILLTIGAALCSLAALLFAAYAWGHLGLGGRVICLSTVTAIAGIGGFAACKKGLKATAEALTALCILLCIIDAGGAYRLNLSDLNRLHPGAYIAAVAVVLTAGALAYRQVARLHSTAWLALLAGQVAVPALITTGMLDTQTTVSVAIGLQAFVVAFVAHVGITNVARRAVAAGMAIATYTLLFTLNLAAAFATSDTDVNSIAPLAIVALTAAGIALTVGRHNNTVMSAAIPAAVTAIAFDAVATVVDLAPTEYIPVGIAAVALGVLASAWPLRRFARNSVTSIGLTGMGLSALWAFPGALIAIGVPVARAATPWTLNSSTDLYTSIAPFSDRMPGLAVLLTIGIGAIAALVVGEVFNARRQGLATASGLAIAAAAVFPVVAEVPFAAAIAWYTAVGTTVLLGGGYLVRNASQRLVAIVGGAVLITQGVLLSGGMDLTTAVNTGFIGLVALAITILDRKRVAIASPIATLAISGAVASALAAAGQPGSIVAASLVITGLTAAVIARFSERDAEVAQVAGLTLATLGALSAADDPTALSITLASFSAASAIAALRKVDRWLAWASAGSLLLFIWLRFAIADIAAVEAYTLPLAALVLTVGHVIGGRQSQNSSWVKYGIGLALAFLPTLFMLTADENLVRHIGLLVGALIVMVLGAQRRLQAPIVIAAFVLVAESLAQFAPYAHLVPRWVGVGTAGVVLLALGATWERRYRDLQVLKGKYEALR